MQVLFATSGAGLRDEFNAVNLTSDETVILLTLFLHRYGYTY